ncbi:hypothetical protein ACOMHN_060105 [Nucella lapillus]
MLPKRGVGIGASFGCSMGNQPTVTMTRDSSWSIKSSDQGSSIIDHREEITENGQTSFKSDTREGSLPSDYVMADKATGPMGGGGMATGFMGGGGMGGGGMGGGGMAPGSVGGEGMDPGSVGGGGMAPGSVGGGGMALGSVGGEGMDPGSVSGGGMAPGSVGGGGMGVGGMAPGSVGWEGMAPGSVVGGKMAPGSVGGGGMAPGSVGGGVIGVGEMAPGSVGGEGMDPGSVGGEGMDPGSVGGGGIPSAPPGNDSETTPFFGKREHLFDPPIGEIGRPCVESQGEPHPSLFRDKGGPPPYGSAGDGRDSLPERCHGERVAPRVSPHDQKATPAGGSCAEREPPPAYTENPPSYSQGENQPFPVWPDAGRTDSRHTPPHARGGLSQHDCLSPCGPGEGNNTPDNQKLIETAQMQRNTRYATRDAKTALAMMKSDQESEKKLMEIAQGIMNDLAKSGYLK